MKIKLTLFFILIVTLFTSTFIYDYLGKMYIEKTQIQKFISYKSSILEREWLNILKKKEKDYYKDYCNLIKPFEYRLDELQNDIFKCKRNNDSKCEGNDLSYFLYKNKDGDIIKEYIEPLFGILRNTFSVCDNDRKGDILSKNYLLPSYLSALRKPIVYIDAGASTFNDGEGGASQSYFYKFYQKYSAVRYKKWYLWEIAKQNFTNIFKEIPEDLISKYEYKNKPIVNDINSDDNPLFYIKKHQNQYFIIFKIDVDNNNVELPIFNYLINKNDIFPDEFYYEYHFYQPYMMQWWNKELDYNCSLYCASMKFLRLRKKGIRSHAWV